MSEGKVFALPDSCLEGTTAAGAPPDSVTTAGLARRVTELYWPQTNPCAGLSGGCRPASELGRPGAEREAHGRPVRIDLDVVVPAAMGGPGARATRLPDHGDRVARKAAGLELSLIDNDVQLVGSLDDGDQRAYRVRVAGP
jgi:hypothetical protein